LKNGETPISGPLPDDEEFGEAGTAAGSAGGWSFAIDFIAV